jgi:hypothetical protein
MAEELTGDEIGEIPRTSIPSPYAYSPTHAVFQTMNGKQVIIVETKHKQYDVFEIPKGILVMPVEKNPSARKMHAEELKGAGEYLHMAQKIRTRGYPSIARGFEGMAKDEARHAGYIDVAKGVGAIRNPDPKRLFEGHIDYVCDEIRRGTPENEIINFLMKDEQVSRKYATRVVVQAKKMESIRTIRNPRDPTRFSYLHDDAHAIGLCVATYSPGDGVTRYRFFPSPDGKCVNYFEGTRSAPYGVYTALGLKAAHQHIKNIKAIKVTKNPKKKPWSKPSGVPKPEFKLGDKVNIMGTGWNGTISFIGEYDNYVGSYRYKVLETNGTRKWWHGSALQLIGKTQKNPEMSKLNLAENALRDLALFYGGRIPASQIKFVLNDKRWGGIYGKANLQKAWQGLVKDKFVVQKGNTWEWPIMIEMEIEPEQRRRIKSAPHQNPMTPYPKTNMVRIHGWKIYMMDDRVTVENTKSGFIDYPSYRAGGHLSWNYPERVPRYVKGAVVDYFQRLNKEEIYYEPNGILSWVKSKIIKSKEQPVVAAPVAAPKKNPVSHPYGGPRYQVLTRPPGSKEWLLEVEYGAKIYADQVAKAIRKGKYAYIVGPREAKVVEKNPGTAEQNPTVYHIQKERQILEDLKGGDMTLLDLARSLVIPADELLAFSRVVGKMAAARKIYEKSIGKGLPTYYSLHPGTLPGAVIAKKNPRKKSDYLRDLERPTVLGHELDKRTLAPVKRYVDTKTKKDYGADPLGDNKYRMVPSGDIVDFDERTRRLQTSKHWTGYKKNPALPGQCPLDDTEITYDNDDGHIVHPTRKVDGTDIYTGECKRGCKIEFRYGRWGGELRIDGKPV